MRRLEEWLAAVEVNVIGKWIFYGVLIGIVGGLGAWIFMLILDFSKTLFTLHGLNRLAPMTAHWPEGFFVLFNSPWWWIIPFIPVAGGLISGFLVYAFAPEAEGHGTDSVINSFHNNRGLIRARVPVIKVLASAAIIGSGGSAGREGPIAQIGAGFGSLLGRRLGVSVQDRRLMVLAGSAAGISAIFQAPLGAALFMTEVLYRNHELETEALIPAVISSLTAYSVYTRLAGQEQLFTIPPALSFQHPIELAAYAILGGACVLAGIAYVKFFYGLRDWFKALRIPNWIKPAVGGLALGALVLVLPQVWGGGYDIIQMAMEHKLAAGLLLALVAGKIVATSLTISSGGSGGVFAPSLFIGAMLGGGIGSLLPILFPGALFPNPTAMAVVGMGGFFAGVAKVPLASIIMVSEMTGGYGLLVPMMLVSTISVLFTRRYSLYEKQALSTLDSPAHIGDFKVDLMSGLSVADTPALTRKPQTVRTVTPLSELFELSKAGKQSVFPVVDGRECIGGLVYFEDLRNVLFEGDLELNLVIAADVLRKKFPYLLAGENLHSGIMKFSQYNIEELPILEEENGRLLGLLTKHDVIYTYNQKLAALAAAPKISRGGFL